MYIKSVKATRLKMTDIESDRISCLLDQLIDNILSYLSIKEAGRTSVLSRKWGKKWSTQPDLVFDKRSVSTLALEDLSIIRRKFLRMIDHVLLLHSGPINKFKLSNSGSNIMDVNSLADIHRWILHLTGSNQRRLHGCSSNLLKLFDHQPHIVRLVIGDYFLKYLAAGVVPVKLPTPCMNLTYLGLLINFIDSKEISVVLCLLKSSPKIREFTMFAIEKQPGLLTPASYCCEDIFSKPDIPLGLRYDNIEDISGNKFELDFIKYLLLYSPVLENMIVKPTQNVKPELMTELICFKRASSQAEVIYRGKDS
ncbi:unnamed protein product [Vicia faba]|uniref:F-box domain-containing protein n=1 Tax=Vicia faba TaxID=3906 RepID=A0AAV0ZTG7_VICFA|nr:unnamed protein product [Vicia faba]